MFSKNLIREVIEERKYDDKNLMHHYEKEIEYDGNLLHHYEKEEDEN